MSLDVQPTVERPSPAGVLLEVDDLKTHFLDPRGRVKAVDGVSFTLAAAGRWAWWASLGPARRSWPARS